MATRVTTNQVTVTPTSGAPPQPQQSNTFGSVLVVPQSLFGNQAQSFSNQPALQNLMMQNQAIQQAGLADLSLQKNAAFSGAGIGTQSAQDKANIEVNKAVRMKEVNKPNTVTSSTTKPSIDFIPAHVIQSRLANEQFQRSLITSDRDRYNQQLLNNAQIQAQQQITNTQTAAQQAMARTQADAQIKAASMAAQGALLSSLFGAVSAGAPNYRYWSN